MHLQTKNALSKINTLTICLNGLVMFLKKGTSLFFQDQKLFLSKKTFLNLFFLFLFVFLLTKKINANCSNINASFTSSQTVICGPGSTTISFLNTSSGTGANAATYKWYLNGTQFSTTTGLITPSTSTITTVGTYNFMLIAIGAGNSCRDTSIVQVFIHPIPTAGFTFTSNQCAGYSIPFTNTSTGIGTYTSYTWNFGDGSSSSLANPSHAYATAGSYTVVLTVSNGAGCTNQISKTIAIIVSPSSSISGDDGDGDTNYCVSPSDNTAADTVIFYNSTTGAISYTWNFGDGSPLFTTNSTASVTHIYTSYATFTVTLAGTGANGCVNTDTLLVVFDKFVSASFVVSLPEFSGCAPHSVTPTNASLNANKYIWSFGDTSAAVTTTSFSSPNYIYNAPGNYTISLTASNGCNFSVSTVGPIVVVGPPTIEFSATPILGCSPQTVTFSNNTTGASPANNYQWDFGNGSTLNSVKTPPPRVFYQGSWNIRLISGSACGKDTMYQNIVVDSVPIAIITANPPEGCTPLLVSPTNNSIGQDISYQWYVDGVSAGTLDSIPNQTFTAPAGNNAVIDSIQLVATNHCGTDDTTVKIITHPSVVADFTTSSLGGCVNSTITFTQNSLGDSLVYAWDFGNGNTSTLATPPAQTYNTAGIYTVLLTVIGYCGTDTATKTITIVDTPVADISSDISSGCSGLLVNFSNNSTSGATYNWFFNGGQPSTSSTFTPVPITFSNSGNQMVRLEVNLSGCLMSDTTYINVTDIPVLVYSVSPTVACASVNSSITNTSPVTIGDTYFWDFGNGNTSTQQNPPAQTYSTTNSDTIFNIKLVITSVYGCKDSLLKAVTLHPNPQALYTISDDTVCANQVVNFINSSTIANIFYWNFGDSDSSATSNPSHSYNSPGTYTATLIAETSYGCRDTAQSTIVVDSVPVASYTATTACLGYDTQFHNTSVGSVSSSSWDFGDNSSLGTGLNPIHTYATTGKYNVTLLVTNNFGCSDSILDSVFVKPIPVATFTNSTACLGQSTLFTDQSSGTPTSWRWSFGDSSAVDTSQNPSHTYLVSGNFNATLIAIGSSGCADTITNSIVVNPVPTTDFVSDSVCANDAISFNSVSLGAPNTFVWNFGDGATDSTNNASPSHIYTAAGTFSATLIASYSATGCSQSKTKGVILFPHTAPNFVSTHPCLNVTTAFTDSTTNAPIQWSWNFGDGSPIDSTQNPTHLYATADTFLVTLFTQNVFGCNDSIKMNTIVNPLPIAAFTFDTVCQNTSTSFTDQSTSAVSWNWDFDDGGTSTSNSPNHIYVGAASYNVSLIVANVFGCTDTVSNTIIVNPNPISSFTATTACHTYPTIFTNNSSGETEWEWNFGDVTPLDTTVSPTHVFANPANYNVELLVTNVYGCTDTNTLIITVLPQPIVNYSVPNICARDTILFTDISLGTGIVSWTWDFDDGGADTLKNPLHAFQQNGNYNASLIISNTSGCKDTIVQTLVVHTVPSPLFSANAACLGSISSFTDLSTDAVPLSNWFYDFDDGNNSISQNPNYIFYQGAGVYNVSLTVTNINGCDSSTIIPVTIKPVPVAKYTVDAVCIGTVSTFTDSSSNNPTSWQWTFGDGSTDTIGPVTTHLYATAGSFITSLTVSSGAGCTDMVFQVVEVNADVLADINTTNSTCINKLVTMNDNSVISIGSLLSATWDFGDGSPIVSTLNTSHVYTATGSYIISHTVVSDAGCANTAFDTIVVNPDPVANFTSTNTCHLQNSFFNDNSSSNPTTWDWDFGDGGGDTLQNPTHSYSLANDYDVTLIATSAAGCADTITNTVTVYPKPNASFTSNLVCWGDTTLFTNTSTSLTGFITGTSWDFGDSTSTTTSYNASHIYTVPNNSFNVTLAITTSLGCADTLQQTVSTYPLIQFNYEPQQTSGCNEFTTIFTDSSTVAGGTIVNWLWDFGDSNLTFIQTPTHTYDAPGSFYVSLTATSSFGCQMSDTLNYPVVVYPTPVAGFTTSTYQTTILETEVEFDDNSQGASLWDYNFGDNETSILQNPIHNYPDTGTFLITQIVFNQFGCQDTAQQTVVINAINTAFIPNAFTPDENGLNETFSPQFSGVIEFGMLIYDRWGNLLFKTNDINEGWNGRRNGVGDLVMRDVYVYKIITKDIFQNNHSYSGRVTVVR